MSIQQEKDKITVCHVVETVSINGTRSRYVEDEALVVSFQGSARVLSQTRSGALKNKTFVRIALDDMRVKKRSL